MNIGSIFFTADSAPGPYGFAEEVYLPGDTWDGVFQRPYQPFVFDYTDKGRPAVFSLSNGWVCVDQLSVGEVYVVFLDGNEQQISDPVLLVPGNTYWPFAAKMRVVAVRIPGHVRLLHGNTNTPISQQFSNSPYAQRFITLSFSSIATWETYQSPDGDAGYGVVRVSPVESGVSGNLSSNRALAPNPTGFNATHYEFLHYGFAYMRQDPELIGTVTGGIYVAEFQPINTVVTNGASSNAAVPTNTSAVSFPAVYYKLTSAGVTAGAIPPDRKFLAQGQKIYNRSQSPFNVA